MNTCIFYKIVNGELDSYKVYEDKSVIGFLDINAASEGHTLVIPKKHYENIYDIPKKELCELIKVVKKLAIKFKNKLKINNIQILNSSGKEAQQDVPHFHFHIVPRFSKDNIDLSYKSHPEYKNNFNKLLKELK